MSLSIERPAEKVRTLRSLATRHPLVGFFLLAYGYSWLELLLVAGLLRLPAAVCIGLTTFAPACAALTITALGEGRAGAIRLLRPLLLWRVSWMWYVFALGVIPIAYLLGTLVLPEGRTFAPMAVIPWLVTLVVVFILGAILGGPLGEEPGWRGFALPRLQRARGPLAGSLILGVLWGCWHLPQYLVGDWAAQNGGAQVSSVATFLALVVALAVIFTWLYNHTRGSLLLAVLAHASINTAQAVVINRLFPAVVTELNALIGFGALAVILVIATRGRLGYGAEASE